MAKANPSCQHLWECRSIAVVLNLCLIEGGVDASISRSAIVVA